MKRARYWTPGVAVPAAALLLAGLPLTGAAIAQDNLPAQTQVQPAPEVTPPPPSTEATPPPSSDAAPQPAPPVETAEPDTDTDVDKTVKELRQSGDDNRMEASELARATLDKLKSSYAELERKATEASEEMRQGWAANKDAFELLTDQARLRLKDLDEAAASGWDNAKSDAADALQRMSEWLKGQEKSSTPPTEPTDKPAASEQRL